MRAPEFWRHDGFAARVLAPLSGLVTVAGRRRRHRARPLRLAVPVVCVGNLVAGGAGKTPVVLALLALAERAGVTAHALTRGYGGRLAGPVQVDPTRHDAAAVGDEALLLARRAPVWVARDRPAGARAAAQAGAAVIIMDDGFQNPSLHKALSLLVVDPDYGFGNGRVVPAGPLREPVADGLARAHAVVGLASGPVSDQGSIPHGSLPLFRAQLRPDGAGDRLRGKRVLAFAGIGRPEKFFTTLENLSCELVARHAFADHHHYRDHELVNLIDRADREGALPVTTEKDLVRIPAAFRPHFTALPVTVVWEDADAVDRLFRDHMDGHAPSP